MPRLLILMALMAGKTASTKAFWYIVTLAISGYLTIAPVAQRWDNKATAKSFMGVAVTLPIAWALSRDVSMQATYLKAKRRISFQASIDEMVHQFNEIRTINSTLIKEIEGKSQDWMSNPLSGLGMPMMMPVPVAGELPQAVDDDTPRFNLDMIRKSPKSHVLLVGDTGSGKTTLAKYLSIELFGGQDIAVYDVDDDGNTWGQFPVFGQEDDFTEISACLKLDMDEFGKRSADRINGSLSDRKVVRIIEEMPSTLSEVTSSYEWLMTLLRRGRKRNMSVVGITQDRNISALKCKNKEGSLQEISARTLSNFTVIYLKAEAFAALDRVRDRDTRKLLRVALEQCERPALVEFEGRFYAWEVLNLSNWKMPDMGMETQIYQELCDDTPKSEKLETTTIQTLENLLAVEAHHPVERYYYESSEEGLINFFSQSSSNENKDPLESSFIDYCNSKKNQYADNQGWFDFEKIRTNWARNKGMNASDFKSFLITMNQKEKIEFKNADVRVWRLTR